MCRDPLRHVDGHDGLHADRILRHGSRLFSARADKVKEQHAGLVAGEKHVLASLVPDGNSHPVAVRVRRQQKVRLILLRILHAQLHGLADFRVRIGAGREISVRLFLFFYYCDVGKTRLLQRAEHRLQARAVQRRVDNSAASVHGSRRSCLPGRLIRCSRSAQHGLRLYRLHKRSVNLFPDVMNQAFFHAFFKAYLLHIRKDVKLLNFRENLTRRFRGDLAAVRTVYLVAVVFRRIVGSSHHDARRAAKLPHRKRKAGRGHELRINMRLNAVGREHAAGCAGKEIRLDAGVIAHRDFSHFRRESAVHVIGEPLGGLRHRINVHPVRPGANHAAKAAGPESEIPVKGVLDFCVIARDGLKLRRDVRVLFRDLVFPRFVCFHVV